ncbi:hypothetical protein HPB47_018928, partial [Ixodes persulcatus]
MAWTTESLRHENLSKLVERRSRRRAKTASSATLAESAPSTQHNGVQRAQTSQGGSARPRWPSEKCFNAASWEKRSRHYWVRRRQLLSLCFLHGRKISLSRAPPCRPGEIVDIRQYGTSNEAQLTFDGQTVPRYVNYNSEVSLVRRYKKTIPACVKCGTVGHRADTCPNPNGENGGLCGQKVSVVEGVRAPHDCQPKCATCGLAHATKSRECAGKFRPLRLPTSTARRLGPLATRRSGGEPGHSGAVTKDGAPRQADVTETKQRAPPAGGDVKRQQAPPPPPHGAKGQAQTSKTDGTANAWAGAVKNGKQVSGSGGIASSPSPPSHSHADIELQKQMAALRTQNKTLLTKVHDLESRMSSNPTNSLSSENRESEPEASSPTFAAAPAEMEARLNTKLTSMVSEAMERVLTKVMEAVPAVISRHVAENARLFRRSGPIRDVSSRSRSPKPSRWVVGSDTEDGYPALGVESPVQPLGPGSGSASPITITQWNCRGFRARSKRANLRLYIETFESLPAVVALQELAELASTLGLTLHTDPVHPTRLSNFVTRDTCPDLTFTHNIQHADWLNTEKTLGKVVSDVDNNLLHLWEARHCLVRRWRRQKHNKKLKARIAELTQRAAEYAAQLADSNWVIGQTNCGHRAFQYIRQFLTDRHSYIRIQDHEHGPFQLGTRGTPQDAVLSPLLFNLAMMHLPAQLGAVAGVQHALYADDITLWATLGSLGDIEANLQQAATIYPIPETQEFRVLGLFIHQHRKPDTTLAQLRKVGYQVGRMVRRDALRLANAFVTSRILYSAPYLHLRKQDEDSLEVILRKIFKRALDLPVNFSNQRLLALGMTESGRRLLARLHIQHTTLMEERVRIPTPWIYTLHVRPLPAKMIREDHDGRRLARAEALARHYGSKPGVYYVDASGPQHGRWYTAVVVHETKTVNGLSFRARDITHAEEVAVALATSHPDSKCIITDSRGACRNVEQGWTPYLAYRILQNCIGDPADRYIIWALAHQGLAGNEAADAAARALSLREVSSSPSEQDADPNPAYTFKDITSCYQSGHSLYPHPCTGLSKADGRLLLRLYTNTLRCPAILKHFDHAFTGSCPHCGEVSSDIYHMVWACPSNPAIPPHPSPTIVRCNLRTKGEGKTGRGGGSRRNAKERRRFPLSSPAFRLLPPPWP